MGFAETSVRETAMKHPLAWVLAAYTAGVVIGHFFQMPWLWLFGMALAAWTISFFLPRTRFVGMALTLALAGWMNAQLHELPLAADDLRRILGSDPAWVSIRGTLEYSPTLHEVNGKHDQGVMGMGMVRVNAIKLGDDWQVASGTLLATAPGDPGPLFFTGQSVEINGVAAPPPGPLADGLFDERSYLAARNIYFELKAPTLQDWQTSLPLRHTPPLTDRFLTWAKGTLAMGLPVEDEPLRLLWAMALGWRTGLHGAISDPFLQAGTMHMFAIDGLRIALLSGILVAVLRALQLSRGWSGLLVIPLIWFYTAATHWEAPAVRASIMMTIVLGGWAMKRPHDLLNSLACAALIILVADPRQLGEASFQLSFFVMLSLALMIPAFHQATQSWFQPDPLLPLVLVPRPVRAGLWTARWLNDLFITSLAAWLGSLPLSIKYFHLASLVSTPANLLAVPCGTLALMANLASLATGSWAWPLTILFNHAAWFFMVAMTWASTTAASLPGAFFYICDIPWWLVLAYYAGIIWVFAGKIPSGRHRARIGIFLFVLFLASLWGMEHWRREPRLTVLPLNGGHAVYLAARHSRDDLLLDCGNGSAFESILKPFLRAQGVNFLPRVVLTTSAVRNAGAAAALASSFRLGGLCTGVGPDNSPRLRQVWSTLPANKIHITPLHAGDTFGVWTVLYPPANPTFSRSDDNALVLSGNLSGLKVLLLSDLGPQGQAQLLEQSIPVAADVLVCGLPAEGEPIGNGLLAAIHPKAVVVADSSYPATRKAGHALKSRLESSSAKIFYTSQEGAITLVANPSGWQLASVSRNLMDWPSQNPPSP